MRSDVFASQVENNGNVRSLMKMVHTYAEELCMTQSDLHSYCGNETNFDQQFYNYDEGLSFDEDSNVEYLLELVNSINTKGQFDVSINIDNHKRVTCTCKWERPVNNLMNDIFLEQLLLFTVG